MSFNLMGILNATPDSFSDGGEYFSCEHFESHLISWINNEYCRVIDIGVESTAPLNDPISPDEELRRLNESQCV